MSKDSDSQPDLSDGMVNIAIDNAEGKEYLMVIDKIDHSEDLMVFLTCLLFVVLNVLLAYFAPNPITELNKFESIDEVNKTITVGIQNIKPCNMFIDVRMRLKKDTNVTNISRNVNINGKYAIIGTKKKMPKRTEKNYTVPITMTENDNGTNWFTLFHTEFIRAHTYVFYFTLLNCLEDFSDAEIQITNGSYAYVGLQIWCRSVYSILIYLLLRYFKKKMEGVDKRHEQMLTTALLSITQFFNNPTLIICTFVSIMPIHIFNDILQAIFSGYFVFFLLVVIGHIGIRETFTGKFLLPRTVYAGIFGMTMAGRNIMRHLVMAVNPLDINSKAERIVIYMQAFFTGIVIIWVLIDFILACIRSDAADHFRLVVYSLAVIIGAGAAIYSQCLVPSLEAYHSHADYLVLAAVFNTAAAIFCYCHLPFAVAENNKYRHQKDNVAVENDLQLSDENLKGTPLAINDAQFGSDNSLGLDDSTDEMENLGHSSKRASHFSDDGDDNDDKIKVVSVKEEGEAEKVADKDKQEESQGGKSVEEVQEESESEEEDDFLEIEEEDEAPAQKLD